MPAAGPRAVVNAAGSDASNQTLSPAEGYDILKLVEELILLLFRDGDYRPGSRLWQPGLSLRGGDGSIHRLPTWSLHYAIAGGVLMDLAMENRVDTDLDSLILLDPTPTGDSLLDPTLADIAAGEPNDARFWLDHAARRAQPIHEEALSRLVANGVIQRHDYRLLEYLPSRRYSLIEGSGGGEVRSRIMDVLFTDVIPAPRDVMIICLADACGIFDRMLSSSELETASPRIDLARRLELIGRVVSHAIRDVQGSIDASRRRPIIW